METELPMTAQTSSPNVPLFRTLTNTGSQVDILVNGQLLTVPNDRSLAAALLGAGMSRFRGAAVSGSPRAPYCMMGVCFECLVEVDGVPGRQSCMIPVRAGMQVRTVEESSDLALTVSTSTDKLEVGHGS